MGICCSCNFCNTLTCCSWCGYYGPSQHRKLEANHKESPDWMSHLAQKFPGAKLRDCMILGTHDSGSFSASPKIPCNSVARTTRLSVYEQLKAGARYLDLRLGGDGKKPNSVRLYHGIFPLGLFCTSVTQSNNDVEDITQFHSGVEGKSSQSNIVQNSNQAEQEVFLSKQLSS